MSQERNIKWLNDRRVVYRQFPINDVPTVETNKYMFFENGTYEHYSLFNTKAKITTYKSLKWHFLVLYYLNQENGLLPTHVYEFIANKENGFVTFFISKKVLNDMIDDVFKIGGEPPVNKVRKVIFKDYSMLTINEKLSIVGKLIGRSSRVDDEAIYQCMLDLNDLGKHICIGRIAGLLNVSKRTIYRHINDELKQEIKILNEEI
jgi:DNA-binding transcriptional ArsR family regulator